MTEALRAVDVAAIEHELARLREQAAAEAGTPYPTVRASILNLVVYAVGADVAARARETIRQLVEQHPSRTIILTIEPQAEPGSLPARIAVHCHEAGGGTRQVCCEEIRIVARGQMIEHLPSIVAPLLHGDLPVFLWWPGQPPFGTRRFDDVVVHAGRLIVDSAEFGTPWEALADLAAQARREHFHVALSDFNWARLTPWRELTAGLFDAPQHRPYLERLDGVVIAYEAAGDAPNPAQALLLAGWLAARLGWQPVPGTRRWAEGNLRLRMARPGGTVAVEIDAVRPGDGIPGRLASLTLRAGDGATFSVARAADGCAVATAELALSPGVSVAGTNPFEHVAMMESPNRAQLLARELDIFGHDRVYEESLAAAGALMGGEP